jgi:hypothetical protein
MIDGGWLVVVEPDDPVVPGVIGLQRVESVGLVLKSAIVPGGQVPPGLAALPPELLLAPGPVVVAVPAAGGGAPGVPGGVEGESGGTVVRPPDGAVVPDVPPLVPDVPPPEICATAATDRANKDAVMRGSCLMTVIAGSRMWK